MALYKRYFTCLFLVLAWISADILVTHAAQLGSATLEITQATPAAAVSAGQAGQTISFSNPLSGKTFADVAKAVAMALVAFGIPILVIMIIWGAFQLITSGGDPAKVSAGKKTLLWAAVGFIILLLAEEIPATIEALLGP